MNFRIGCDQIRPPCSAITDRTYSPKGLKYISGSAVDPDWIRIQWGPRIRIQIRIRNPDQIRIQEGKNDP